VATVEGSGEGEVVKANLEDGDTWVTWEGLSNAVEWGRLKEI